MEKLKSVKIFECLNAEKPTPLFMSLARYRSTAKKLSAINKDDGSPYNTDNDTNEGIISFYENLYKKPADERLNYDNCIEDFLWAGIVNHPLVQIQCLQKMSVIFWAAHLPLMNSTNPSPRQI
jgi:hypothetical protein